MVSINIVTKRQKTARVKTQLTQLPAAGFNLIDSSDLVAGNILDHKLAGSDLNDYFSSSRGIVGQVVDKLVPVNRWVSLQQI